MAGDQQFCLRWNNHQNTLVSVFDSLLESGSLVDCTLAAEGRFLQAHKIVLSACSPYFSMLLREHHDKYPILILKDVKYQELQAMMNYMYRGEVNITQEQLGSFLKAAESLQIRGLTDSSENNRDNGHIHPKKVPEPRKIIVSQSISRSRSPTIHPPKKHLKHQIENHVSRTNDFENVIPSIKRKKLLPPIKSSDGLVVTPINPTPYNNIDVSSSTCDLLSAQIPASIPALEGKPNMPSPSITPKLETFPVKIENFPINMESPQTEVVSTVKNNDQGIIVRPTSIPEQGKLKCEIEEDYNNDDTSDSNYTMDDGCENEKDENSIPGSSIQGNAGGFENVISQDGNAGLQDSQVNIWNIGPARSRHVYSTGQVRELEDEFKQNHYVPKIKRLILSEKLHLTEQQIKVWFQNRRSKQKRMPMEKFDSPSGNHSSSDEHELHNLFYDYRRRSCRVREKSPDSVDSDQESVAPTKTTRGRRGKRVQHDDQSDSAE